MVADRRLEVRLNPSAISTDEGAQSRVESSLIELNTSQPIPFRTEGFDGHMLFLHRPTPEHDDWPYSEHFRGKERRFEWRVQGKFLADPGDGVHFGAEFEAPIQLSWFLRTTATWILGILEMLSHARGHGFSYSLDHVIAEDGSTILPHLAFPLCAADSINVTPPGEVPPSIMGSFDATPAAERLRVRANTEDIFTFVYWSKYTDFVRWEIMNMPLGWSSSFADFIGDGTPMHMVCYRLEDPAGQHSKSNQRNIVRLEMTSLPATSQLPIEGNRQTIGCDVASEDHSEVKNCEDHLGQKSWRVNMPSIGPATVPVHGSDGCCVCFLGLQELRKRFLQRLSRSQIVHFMRH